MHLLPVEWARNPEVDVEEEEEAEAEEDVNRQRTWIRRCECGLSEVFNIFFILSENINVSFSTMSTNPPPPPPEREKPKFEDYVKKYIEVDDEIESLQIKLKTMRDWKRKLNGVIVKHMEDQDLVEHTLEVSDGTLRYNERKEYGSMSFTYIEKSLHQLIPDPEQVKYVIQFLKDNREIKTVAELKRRKYSSDSSESDEDS